MRDLSCLMAGFSLIAATLAFGPPASAQEVEPITVMGHHAAKNRPDTFSYRVGYADLDLQLGGGQKEFRRRVSMVAGYVCKKLGEGSSGACVDQAVRDAEPQVKAAIAHAKTRPPHWKRGPKWTPPPAD
jgi:UrcA family protein